jgi:hypothetical protein
MKKLLLILQIFVISFSSQAIESTTSLSTSAPEISGTDKADETITNRRFRASNGSLSNFSLSTEFNYNGGSVEDPLAATRPNISNAGDTALISGISGSIGATYRISDLNRINLGVGIQMLAPFHSSSGSNDANIKREFDDNAREFDASNPRLSYTHMNKFWGIQTIINTGYTQYTAGNLTDRGYQNNVDLTINTMYEVGKTGFSYGLLFTGTRNFFDDDRAEFLASQNETVFGFLPQAEYIINDTFNLRTIVRSHWYQNNREDGAGDYTKRPVTQSVGLGISVNRDIFIYPNLQFAYNKLDLANTNIGLQASINMF